MSKKLSMTPVRKEVKKYKEEIIIPFYIDGEEYQVMLKPFFHNEGITEIMKELKFSLPRLEQYKLEITDDLLFPYIAYLSLKVFSDLITPNIKDYKTEENYFKADIQYFRDLFNLDYLKILTEHFLESEWQKIIDAVTNIMIINERLERDAKKYQKQIQNLDIQNPEIRERLFGKENLEH